MKQTAIKFFRSTLTAIALVLMPCPALATSSAGAPVMQADLKQAFYNARYAIDVPAQCEAIKARPFFGPAFDASTHHTGHRDMLSGTNATFK